MNTYIHHPSHHFRRTAIAAVIVGALSPSAYAMVAGVNPDSNGLVTSVAAPTGIPIPTLPPTSVLSTNNINGISLGVNSAGMNISGTVPVGATSSIGIDLTGNIASTANATNVLNVTGGGSLTANTSGVTITGTTNTIQSSSATGGNLTTSATGVTLSMGGVATPVLNATNVNSNTSAVINASGASTATSIYSATGRVGSVAGSTATQGTQGNISTVTGNSTIGTESVSSVVLTNGQGNVSGLQVFEDHTNLNGTNVNLNATNNLNQNANNITQIVANDLTQNVTNNLTQRAGNLTQAITNNISTTSGNVTETTGNLTQTVIGNVSETAGNLTQTVTGNVSETAGNLTQTVTGNITETAGNITHIAVNNITETANNLTQTVTTLNLTASQGVINLGQTNSSVTAQFGNFTNVNAGNATVNNLTATNISAVNGTFSGNLASGNLTTNGTLTANNAFVNGTLNATDVIARNNVSGINGNFTNVNAADGNFTNNLTVNNTVNAGNLTTNGTLTANNAFVNGTLNATDVIARNNVSGINGNFTNINATNNITAGNGNFTDINTNNITANNTVTNNLTANNTVINDLTVTGNSTLTGNISINGTLNVSDLNATNVTAGNGNFTNLTTANGNITNLTSANSTITNLTSNNITAGNVTAGNGNFTNITADNGNITNLTSINLTATTLNVTGQTTMSGINNTGPLNNTGNLTNVGNTTLTGNTVINGGLNLSNANVTGLNINPGLLATDRIMGDPAAPLSSNGVTGTNTVVGGTGGVITYKEGLTKTVVANTTIGNRLAGAQYQTQVAGNELIDGNLYVNGDTAFVGTNKTTATVDASNNLASSKIAGATTGVIGQTGITTTDPAAPVTDIVTGVATPESVASTTLMNGAGKTNGLQVFEDRTRLTGGGDTAGAPSSAITLNSNGTSILGNPAATLASNGVTGNTPTNPGASVGTGGLSVFGTPATVAPNTTIGDRLNGVQYQDKLNGNTLVDGNLYVNGDTNFVGKTGATSTVVGDLGTSKFANATMGVTGQTGVVVKGAPVVDPVTGLAAPAPESVASSTLTNGLGQTNGLSVYEDRTTLSGGGSTPSSVTFNDNSATFATSTGAPAKVTGVADGTSKYDAVNYGQLQAISGDVNNVAERAYSGIAQTAAISALPTPMAGHHYSVGMGGGFYAGQQAIAFGGKADVGEHVRVSAAMGSGLGSTSQMTANVGAGFSW